MPILVFLLAAAKGSAILKWGMLATFGTAAALRAKHHQKDQDLDYNKHLAKALGRDGWEWSVLTLRKEQLPGQMKRFAGTYAVDERDLILLYYAVLRMEMHTGDGELGRLVTMLARRVGVPRQTMSRHLFRHTRAGDRALPKLLGHMKRVSAKRLEMMEKAA
jgi:hypothetical protein